jgi:hypothetical protein
MQAGYIDDSATIGSAMALERELATYKAHLPSLLEKEGKYVLIHGDDVLETFAAYEDAIKDGYRRFGLQPFLVKQISSIEKVQYITRFVAPHATA